MRSSSLPSRVYFTPTWILENESSTSSFVMLMLVYPFIRQEYCSCGMSSQPQRRGLPVVVPNQWPTLRRVSPGCSPFSVGKGPSPTRVVYAFTTPMVSPKYLGGIPSPVNIPPTEVLEEVTYGQVPKSRSNITAFAPSNITLAPGCAKCLWMKLTESITILCQSSLSLQLLKEATSFSSAYLPIDFISALYLAWKVEKSSRSPTLKPERLALVLQVGPIPRFVVPMLWSPSSRFVSNATWALVTSCARSETNTLPSHLSPSSAFISLKRPSRLTTTPLPSRFRHLSWRMPQGSWWKAYFLPWWTTVCPALLPPLNLAQRVIYPERKSTSFPLPQSPHCAPRTATALFWEKPLAMYLIIILQDFKRMNKQAKRFAKFQGKQKEQKNAVASSHEQILVLNTHLQSEYGSDFVIGADVMPRLSSGTPVLVIHHKGDREFVCQVTRDETLPPGKASLLRIISDLYGLEYEIGFNLKCTVRILGEEAKKEYDKKMGIQLLEISVKDAFFSRRDQFKLTKVLKGQAVFAGKYLFFGGVKLQVTGLVYNKFPENSGLVTESTKYLFRSQCANSMILIELSRQLLQFERGLLGWQKVRRFLNVYLTRNSFLQNNHRIEVYIYARIQYPQFRCINQAYREFVVSRKLNEKNKNFAIALQVDSNGTVCQDIIRRVSLKRLGKNIDSWNLVANQVWRKVVQLLANINWKIEPPALNIDEVVSKTLFSSRHVPFTMPVPCKLSSSRQSPLLEALILISSTTTKNHINRSLSESGVSMTILACGQAQYYAQHCCYKAAKESILSKNISCCYVSLREGKKKLQFQVRAQAKGYINQKRVMPNLYNCLQSFCYSSPLQLGIQFQKEKHFYSMIGIREEACEIIEEDELGKFGLSAKELNCGHKTHYYFRPVAEAAEPKIKSPHWIEYVEMDVCAFRAHVRLFEKFTVEPRLLLDCPESLGEQLCVVDKVGAAEVGAACRLQSLLERHAEGEDVDSQVNAVQSSLDERALKLEEVECSRKDTPEHPNIFYCNYQKPRKQSKSSEVSVDEPKQPKRRKKHSHLKERWQMIDKESTVHYYLLQHGPDVKRRFKEIFLGVNNKDSELMQLKRDMQREYFWKYILMPPMMPLFTHFYEENQEGKLNLQNYSPSEQMNLEESLLELISLRLAYNFQLVDLHNCIDQFGNRHKLDRPNTCVLVKNKQEHRLVCEKLSKNIRVELVSQWGNEDYLLLRYLAFDEQDLRCISKYYTYSNKDSYNWSLLDSYLLAFEPDQQTVQVESKKVTIHLIAEERAALAAALRSLNEKFRLRELFLEEEKTAKLSLVRVPAKNFIKNCPPGYHYDVLYLLLSRHYQPQTVWTMEICWVACATSLVSEFIKQVNYTVSQHKKIWNFVLPIDKVLSIKNPCNEFIEVAAEIILENEWASCIFKELLAVEFYRDGSMFIHKEGQSAIRFVAEKKGALVLFEEWGESSSAYMRYNLLAFCLDICCNIVEEAQALTNPFLPNEW